jgi:hypothetical protein
MLSSIGPLRSRNGWGRRLTDGSKRPSSTLEGPKALEGQCRRAAGGSDITMCYTLLRNVAETCQRSAVHWQRYSHRTLRRRRRDVKHAKRPGCGRLDFLGQYSSPKGTPDCRCRLVYGQGCRGYKLWLEDRPQSIVARCPLVLKQPSQPPIGSYVGSSMWTCSRGLLQPLTYLPHP